jgi:hypothetical protein
MAYQLFRIRMTRRGMVMIPNPEMILEVSVEVMDEKNCFTL